MKIKKGDKVVVITGKNKGHTGPVVRAFPDTNRVVIEDVNVVKKHTRASAQNRKGQIIDLAMPIHVSNVMLVDPKSGKGTRVRFERKDGVRRRIAVKSGEHIQ